MLATTVDVVKAACRADPTMTPAERARLIALVRSGGTPQQAPSRADMRGRVIDRETTAGMFNRSLRFVDRLAAQGILRKCKLPGRVRAVGFLESDVDALIRGES